MSNKLFCKSVRIHRRNEFFMKRTNEKSLLLVVRVCVYDYLWRVVRNISGAFLPYRYPGGVRHRFITGLFFLLLKYSQNESPEFLHELQSRRLLNLIKIADKVPFWRDHFTRYSFAMEDMTSIDFLKKLPPISKKDLIKVDREQCVYGMSYDSDRILRHRTSGTTGVPFEWGIDKNVWFVEVTAYFYRALSWYGGYRPFLRLMIASLVYRSYSAPVVEFFWNSVGPGARAAYNHVVTNLKLAGCSVLFAYPTNLFLLAKNYSQARDNLLFKTIVTTGQRLEDEYRTYIEKKMGCRVASLYGSREFGQMAVECPVRKHWYHINAERLLVEILDNSGNQVPLGTEGLITVTGLDNFVLPLIRYQLGDRGRFVGEGCGCGCRLPLLEFFGREMSFIILPSGSRVPFRHVHFVILLQYFEQVELYQIEQTKLNELVIRYQLKVDGVIPEAIIRTEIQKYIGDDIGIIFEQLENQEITPGRKLQVFIPLAK